jgi:hypothetical protein
MNIRYRSRVKFPKLRFMTVPSSLKTCRQEIVQGYKCQGKHSVIYKVKVKVVTVIAYLQTNILNKHHLSLKDFGGGEWEKKGHMGTSQGMPRSVKENYR